MMNKKFNYDNDFSIYLRVFKEIFLPNMHYFIIAIILMLICAGSVAYRAYLIKPAIDELFLQKDRSALITIPLRLIAVAVILGFATYLENYIMHKTSEDIALSYKEKLFSKLVNLDMDYFQNKNSHKILDQFGDVNGMMTALSIVLTGLVRQFITIVSLIVLMFNQSVSLSCIAFIGFPLIIYPIFYIGRKLRKLAQIGRELSGDLNSTMGESLNLIKLVKANNCEEEEIKKFDRVAHTSHKLSLKMVRKALITSPMIEMAGSIGFAGVIWYGGLLVIKDLMTTGAFFAFITALLSIYKPAKSFAGLNIQMQTALVSARRLFIVLDKENTLKNSKNAIDITNVKGDIEFKNVSFSYPIHDKEEPLVSLDNFEKLSDKNALKNINLTIKNGTNVALIGHSGAGKSTIFNLILRFYDPINGGIFIDGHNLKDITIESLRKNISVVSQDVQLFNASIKDNVKYGTPNATDEEVINACKIANADEFIEELEDGYDTILGPNGSLLSGGQKQRISIARAILKNAPILLLDEATSSLDPISENLIQKALKQLMEGKTTIIIAHKLTTIQNCDKIFVLQEGEIVEEGEHNELFKKKGIYTDLYKKQFEKVM